MNLRPGDRVDRYVVDLLLGRGGMAVVYRVHHGELGTLHALKVLAVKSPDLAERLVHEGRVQGRLRHPNTVAVTDVVRVGESPALVVELVDGPNLADWLGFVRPTAAQIDAVARGILAGVDAAHRLGLVHRDLKPANVLLQVTHDGVTPKVSDFGLAKMLDREVGGFRTRAGTAMGTPAYMPPEQAADASDVDQRADVFSLGALLLELLLALNPEATDFQATVDNVRAGRPLELGWLAGRCPDAWVAAVRAALALDPKDRPPDAGALRDLWTRGTTALPDPWPLGALLVLRSMTPQGPGGTQPMSEVTPPAPTPAPAAEPPARLHRSEATAPAAPTSRRRWAVGAAALLGVLVAGLAVRAALRPPEPPLAAGWAWRGGEVVLVDPEAGPLAPGEVAWRVTYEAGRISRLDRVNARGALWSWDSLDHDRPVSLVLERASDGTLTALVQLVETDEPLHRVVIDHRDGEIVLRHQSPAGDAATSPWVEDLAPDLATHPHALVEVQRLDAAGHVILRSWRGLSGQPAAGDDGSWGVALEVDALGRVTRRTALGPDERPIRDSLGVISVAIAYDDPAYPHTPTRWTLEGIGGLPGLSAAGWHQATDTLDAEGRRASTRYTDSAGMPTPDADGCTRIERQWTPEEHRVRCLDADGAPTQTTRGWATAAWTSNADGFPVATTYLDVSGAPGVDPRGVHQAKREFDAYGRIVQIGPNLDLGGAPVALWGQAAQRRLTLDAYGWPAAIAYLHADGTPAVNAIGAAATSSVYTPRGTEVDLQAWDANGVPVVTNDGWVRITHEVDTRGNTLTASYHDANGALVNSRDGWAREAIRRNTNGDPIEVTFFGADGQRAMSAEEGWSRSLDLVDDQGLVSRTSLFDAADRPVLGPEGWASVAWTHDARGLVSSATYYGTDGERILLTDLQTPLSRVAYTYDAAGRETRASYFDTEDKPVADGCAHNESHYDDRGQDIGWSCIGAEGQPRAIAGTVATQVIELDGAGRRVGVHYLGVDGQPTTHGGLARIRNELDPRGRVTKVSNLDSEGRLIDNAQGWATHTLAYGALGETTTDEYRSAIGTLLAAE